MQQDRCIPREHVHKFVSIGSRLEGRAITRPSTLWPRSAMCRRIRELPSRFQGILGYYVTRHGTASKHEVSRKESFVLADNSFEEEIQS